MNTNPVGSAAPKLSVHFSSMGGKKLSCLRWVDGQIVKDEIDMCIQCRRGGKWMGRWSDVAWLRRAAGVGEARRPVIPMTVSYRHNAAPSRGTATGLPRHKAPQCGWILAL